MTKRVMIGLAVLILLLAGNAAWRIWSGWGLITVNVENAPVRDVVRGIERQSGERIVTNLPADRTVTMRVTKVGLVLALQVLANNANAAWDVAHIAAPDEASIRVALAGFENGDAGGWKIFSLPGMPMMMGGGVIDPRDETLEAPEAADGLLHSYFESASQLVDGQFWVPEDWNPAVSPPPAAARVANVVGSLAGAAGGRSAEVLVVSERAQAAGPGGEPGAARLAGGSSGGVAPAGVLVSRNVGPAAGSATARMPDPATMEKRMLARIEAMPESRREEARREFDERRKFFEEIASLPEEERRERMQEHMEQQARTNGERISEHMTRMDASRTVEQRSDFFRRVIEHKQEASR